MNLEQSCLVPRKIGSPVVGDVSPLSAAHIMSSSATVCVREGNNRELGARPNYLCGLDAP